MAKFGAPEMDQRRTAMHYDYAIEKLYQALGSLIQEGSLRDRLNSANIFIMRLMPINIPDDLRSRFAILDEILAKNAVSLHKRTEERLSDEEAKKAAYEILSLFVELKGGL